MLSSSFILTYIYANAHNRYLAYTNLHISLLPRHHPSIFDMRYRVLTHTHADTLTHSHIQRVRATCSDAHDKSALPLAHMSSHISSHIYIFIYILFIYVYIYVFRVVKHDYYDRSVSMKKMHTYRYGPRTQRTKWLSYGNSFDLLSSYNISFLFISFFKSF